MSVRSYNPSVRVGNWNEDINLEEVVMMLLYMQYMAHCRSLMYAYILYSSARYSLVLQDQLKDFLEKKERGELMIQKTSNLLKTILKEVQQPLLIV